MKQLSPRQRLAAALLLEGCSNQEIADKMHVKLRTVKSYMRSLFVKFDIQGGIKRVKLAVILQSLDNPLEPVTRDSVDNKQQNLT